MRKNVYFTYTIYHSFFLPIYPIQDVVSITYIKLFIKEQVNQYLADAMFQNNIIWNFQTTSLFWLDIVFHFQTTREKV